MPENKLADMPDGLHANVPAHVYHEKVLGLASKGALDEVLRSPAHYRTWVDAVEEEPTPALAFGQAFHYALLEPEIFASTYAVQPDFRDCRFKEAKADKAKWLASHAGMKSISSADAEAIRGMSTAIYAHPRAGLIIRDGVAEHTALWTDRETGLRCRARGDYFVDKHAMLVDVKTTIDASPEGFARSIFNYGYHRQDAFYRGGFAACGADVRYFVFVAVEKVAPYAVGVYQLDVDGVSCGAAKVRQALDTLALCMQTNAWPGYSSHIETIATPPWAS